MKRILGIATTVILGLSAAALAQPRDEYRRGYDDGYDACTRGAEGDVPSAPHAYRKGYADGFHACTLGPEGAVNTAGQPPASGVRSARGWSVLGVYSLAGPSEKTMVGAQAGRFGEVRIEAVRGTPVIRSIDVRYVDDTLQTFPIGRRLHPREVVRVQLGPERPISSITVTGEPSRVDAYELSLR